METIPTVTSNYSLMKLSKDTDNILTGSLKKIPKLCTVFKLQIIEEWCRREFFDKTFFFNFYIEPFHKASREKHVFTPDSYKGHTGYFEHTVFQNIQSR